MNTQIHVTTRPGYPRRQRAGFTFQQDIDVAVELASLDADRMLAICDDFALAVRVPDTIDGPTTEADALRDAARIVNERAHYMAIHHPGAEALSPTTPDVMIATGTAATPTALASLLSEQRAARTALRAAFTAWKAVA